MNENLNLVEILKYCHSGTKLYFGIWRCRISIGIAMGRYNISHRNQTSTNETNSLTNNSIYNDEKSRN